MRGNEELLKAHAIWGFSHLTERNLNIRMTIICKRNFRKS